MLAGLALLGLWACSSEGVGASCSTDDDCDGDLICDVHGASGTCQKPHDHEQDEGDNVDEQTSASDDELFADPPAVEVEGAAEAQDSSSDETCEPCEPEECSVVSPGNALITDWEDVSEDGLFVDTDDFSEDPSEWWLGFFGGPWVYPALEPGVCDEDPVPGFLEQSTDGAWRVTGTVEPDAWAGFGLWFGCMVDMSEYAGVSFTLSGEAGVNNLLNFTVATSGNIPQDECAPNIGACTQDCRDAETQIEVAADGQTVSVMWDDLSGGSPEDGVNPAEITGFVWSLDIQPAEQDLDVTIDDIVLIEP